MSKSKVVKAGSRFVSSNNPFVGTSTRRLVELTTKAVDAHFGRTAAKREKRGRNIFDYAFRFHNLGIGRRYQHAAWKEFETDKSNPQCYWTVTRIVEKGRHPHRRAGKAWGILTWKGKLWHGGEERVINASAVRKWLLIDEDREFPFEINPPQVVQIAAVEKTADA